MAGSVAYGPPAPAAALLRGDDLESPSVADCRLTPCRPDDGRYLLASLRLPRPGPDPAQRVPTMRPEARRQLIASRLCSRATRDRPDPLPPRLAACRRVPRPDRSDRGHSAVSRPTEADIRRPKHRESAVALHSEPTACIRQLDLPAELRRTLLAGDDGAAVNPGAGDEPAVRTGRELGPGMVEIPRMAPNTDHDVRAGAHHHAGIRPDEEAVGDPLPHPPERSPVGRPASGSPRTLPTPKTRPSRWR